MILHPPFVITARLMAGLKVGAAYISIGYGSYNGGRMCYDIYIDLPDGSEHHVDDLTSGVGGGSLQQGMASLLNFLGAAAESYSYQMRTGQESENDDLFSVPIMEWAYQHDDELSSLALELEESENLIEEGKP